MPPHYILLLTQSNQSNQSIQSNLLITFFKRSYDTIRMKLTLGK